jgi:hypothetical protein
MAKKVDEYGKLLLKACCDYITSIGLDSKAVKTFIGFAQSIRKRFANKGQSPKGRALI